MRKAQKIQAEEFVKLLEEVHSEIRKSLLGGDIMAAGGLLTQCQQGAIELGNLIEKTEGEGFVTVTYLEKYCEIVYGMYEELGTDSVPNAEKMYKHLRRALLAVENSVRNDIPVRKEVVFFPYKASMWDSLESVYLAAKEDPACDAYCVPIPYYDRNSDGSFGKMHYEGAEYPKNIEIRDWQTYRLEERRPDAIYIHNPYDEYNYVTSVHPRFYSSNLKKYTDELVYIPYFVLPEIDPQDENMVEKIKHFCLQPGVLNADKVILQSEAMSQIYMNEYIKAAQKNGVSVDRELLKKKYLGIGSPKLDKVKNTKKEDIEIPKEWQKLIQKADGSLKKIVFYNTSINALLVCGSAMLEKMKWVFSVFQKNQEEITLLWRPHPLIRATIESMRPDLWKEYEQMVNDYRSAGWGIYDDTADLNRAIALSDAYYGDYSSVIQLCQEAGIPVMIQDTEYRGDLFRLQIEDAKIIENKVWFVAAECNALFMLNLENDEIKKFDFSVEITYKEVGNYRALEQIEKNVYLIPFKSNELLVFNLETSMYTLIKLKGSGFFATAQYKEFLFLFSAVESIVCRIDLHNNSIQYLEILTNEMEIFDSKDGFFRKQVAVVKDKLFIAFCNANAILELNPLTMHYEIHKMGKTKEGYSGIAYQDGLFWLSPRKSGNIKIWNKESKEIKEISADNNQINNCWTYLGIILSDKMIVLPPMNSMEKMFDNNDKIVELAGCYSFFRKDNQSILLYETKTGTLRVYNEKVELITKKQVRVTRDVLEDKKWVFRDDILISEKMKNDLICLIDYLKSEEK